MPHKLPWICYYWKNVARQAVKIATELETDKHGDKLTMTARFSKDKFKQALLNSGRHNRKVRKMIRGL